MTNGQKLQLRLSEIRQTLNDFSGLDSADGRTAYGEMDTLVDGIPREGNPVAGGHHCRGRRTRDARRRR